MRRRPRFTFTDSAGAVDFTLDLPQRPWNPMPRDVGSFDVSDGGVPVSYVVRTDHLLQLRLVHRESEWPSIHRLYLHLQRGGQAEFYPDGPNDPLTSRAVTGAEMKMGQKFAPTRISGDVYLSTMIVRRVADTLWADEYFESGSSEVEAGTYELGLHTGADFTADMGDADTQFANPNTNREGSEIMRVDRDVAHAFLRWNLEDFLGWTVTAASVHYYADTAAVNGEIWLFNDQDLFVPSELTWNVPFTGGTWTGGTSTRDAGAHGRLDEISDRQGGGSEVWKEWPLNATGLGHLQDVLDGIGLTGDWFCISFFPSHFISQDVRIRSANYSDPDFRPYLEITVS